MNFDELIYLDYPATTPCDERVIAAMQPYFGQFFGNPHSRNHPYGWRSDEAVQLARQQIAQTLQVEPDSIIFTSGATEANTLALRGVLMQKHRTHSSIKEPLHLITTQTEHKSILTCCRLLETEGFEITYLPVDTGGRICLEDLKANLRPSTVLVSIAAVNNETGVIQPLNEIGKICQQHDILFHTDATQALGKMPLNLSDWNVSLASFSAHKIYGPKGIGALYLRRKPPVRLYSFLAGGGQQKGMRGGTLPVPLCVGFGEACRILTTTVDSENERIHMLSQRLLKGLTAIPLAHLNGDRVHKVPHILNVSFPYIEGESLAMSLKNICVSTGSACSSDKLEPSYVLQAMHQDDLSIQSSIRFGLGRFTTEQEVEMTIQAAAQAVQKLRDLSPLWEMYQSGTDLSNISWKAE